jgi:hypothetical protein
MRGKMGVCQKNCGIDYAKCLVTTFDMKECTKTQAGCALECFKTPTKVKSFVGYPITDVQAGVGACEKNCALDLGKCMIISGDIKQCLKDEVACGLDCLKSVSSSVYVE